VESIIPENDKAITRGGQPLVIKTDNHGFYFLDVEGAGGRPKISEQRFTSLSAAKQALEVYISENLGQINKMKFIEEIAGPRPGRTNKVGKTQK
jgi:hypothetical protein